MINVLDHEEQVEILDDMAFALQNLAKDFANKVEIRRLGGIQALVKLLECPDPDVKKNSAMALWNCLDDFGNRSEIRYANGLRPLIELLVSEHLEIQDFGLKCLTKCQEDFTNNVELKKMGLSKRLLEYMTLESTEPNYHTALTCLDIIVQDVESAATIAENNGIPILIKLCANEDQNTKKQASLTLAKALKIEKNQVLVRDSGFLPTVIQQLGSIDPLQSAYAAILIGALAKNDINQSEFIKNGVIEQLFKYLQSENEDQRRESVGALASFCITAKSRTRIRNYSEGLNALIKLLNVEDIPTALNAVECISAFSDDRNMYLIVSSKNEIIKIGGIQGIVPLMDIQDTKLQTSACICLARLLQEAEGQTSMAKQSKQVISKLVAFLGSPDINLCRAATYTLSITAQNETNAINACSLGAIDSLIQLSKQSRKKSTKFAAEGLEKLLNYNISAKYSLLNHLTNLNTIQDQFYDPGFSGINLDKVEPFPPLSTLLTLPVDKRREIILIDLINDTVLQGAISFLLESVPGNSSEVQLKMIAITVSNLMGGRINPDDISQLSCKFRLSELKIAANSNVLQIGKINEGTFYHRALLFKVLCDRIGLKPCSIVRGDYNRCWNVVDPRVQTIETVKPASREKRSAAGNASAKLKNHDKVAEVAATASVNASPLADLKLQYFKNISVEAGQYKDDCPAIVDLMFSPGALLPVDSPEAISYKRISN